MTNRKKIFEKNAITNLLLEKIMLKGRDPRTASGSDFDGPGPARDFNFCRSEIFKILLALIRPGIPAKGLDLI